MARKPRFRHHANPFAFQREVIPPDWTVVFPARLEGARRPLEVDVGCAAAEFLLGRALQAPEVDIVGLELRMAVVDQVLERIARSGLSNAWCVLCNANRSFDALFAPASLDRVYVHFPDPWFKNRHQKRRLVNQAFVASLASRLVPGGEVDFMTDVEEYSAYAAPLFEAHPDLVNVHGPLAPAPFGADRVASHREAWHLSQGDPVWRYHYRRR